MILEVRAIVEVDGNEFDAATFELFLDNLLRKEDVVAESIDVHEIDPLDV